MGWCGTSKLIKFMEGLNKIVRTALTLQIHISQGHKIWALERYLDGKKHRWLDKLAFGFTIKSQLENQR